MILLILRLLAAVFIAFLVGKLLAKIKMPAILGWLLTGMILGPHALGLVNTAILDSRWYQTIVPFLECCVGLLIGTELVWNKIKKSGKQIIVTTLTQSLGTFFLVSLAFGIIFYFMNLPLYLAVIFGGIALATAPAPALSIVREFKTDGPVTKTLIPMAALDDIVGVIVFFTTISIVSANISQNNMPVYMIVLVVLLPIIIGIVTGLLAGVVLKKKRTDLVTILLLIAMLLCAFGVGFICNNFVMPKPVLNFMLIGMAFSATFANMVSEERLEQMMRAFNPILGISMLVVILNLGAPLDYRLIFGAGIFTAVYILTRAAGKYFGAFFGAGITKSPKTVKKFLGLTLLPHSGVSLVFTGIAVSVLTVPAPESAKIVQGTIAAAAVINEIIAVIISKKGFEWAGEFGKKQEITAGASKTDEILYRELQKEDYKTVQNIINQSFGLYRYVEHEKVLHTLLKTYLQSCLAEKTFSCVAEKDGKVVGVILGASKKTYHLWTHLPNICAMAYYNSVLWVQSKLYKVNLSEYKNLHQIYHAFLSGRKNEFDGVLTLFAVTADCRGLGVGKQLLSDFRSYLTKNHTKNIYLYTDSTCNYGFYDSQNFERLDKKELTITCEHKPVQMDVFLYGYKIQ